MLLNIFCSDKETFFDDRAAASFFAMIFISQYPVIMCLFSLKYSRENRLILFRIVAFPTFLVTVTPRRVILNRPGENIATKYLFWVFFPTFDNRINSDLFRILSALVNKKRKRCFPLQPVAIYRFFYIPYINNYAYYTVKRVLPLALRRLIILLPFLVDILFKNPCVRARFILLG